MASLLQKARASYLANPSRRTLRLYLIRKARRGQFDIRMFRYYTVKSNVTPEVRRAVVRAYAAGLVPTSTLDGKHAPGSYHSSGRAVDVGLIESQVGTKYGRRKLVAFQTAEYRRALLGRTHPIELIGPSNMKIILRSDRTSLPEGAPLENQHDDHVHEAF